MCSNATNILSIVVILAVITGIALAVIVSALSVGLILYFSIITSTADIYCTREVRDSNIEINIHTVQNGRVIGCILAVDMLYSFVDVKWGNKLLKILFPLRILKVNKYLIILTPLLNFVVRSIYKGLIASIIIMDHLGTTNNNKAYL